MKTLFKVMSIILIVIGALGTAAYLLLGFSGGFAEIMALAPVEGTLIVGMILSAANCIFALICGIVGCTCFANSHNVKIAKIFGFILAAISAAIIVINIVVFHAPFTGLIGSIIDLALAVLYVWPLVALKEEF